MIHTLSIQDLQREYNRRGTTPAEVCTALRTRIEQLDTRGPALNAVLELAEPTDHADGVLRGVPILLKDNIDTVGDGMETSAGSIALAGVPAAEDAFLVRRLREAGAVILGKANLSEWANFRSTRSNSGWSSRGGQTRNPHVLDRSPCGSSSGSAVAVAAGFVPAAIGTETDGSITCPAAHNSVVGLKPSLGMVSRSGIIPIAPSQDTAGPLTRTVLDAALVMQAISAYDPADRATEAVRRQPDFLAHLCPEYLRGKRIGVARNRVPEHPAVADPFDRALAVLEAAGAVMIDPVTLPNADDIADEALTVLLYEFKHAITEYLTRRSDAASSNRGARTGTPRTLDDLVAFNERHAAEVMPYFGQELFLAAAECGPLSESRYREAYRRSRTHAGRDALERALAEHRLDAVCAPTNAPAWLIDHVNGDYFTGGGMASLPAIAGCPHISVPMGTHLGLPLGLSFVGAFGTDPELLGIAYGYEQASAERCAPQFVTSIGDAS